MSVTGCYTRLTTPKEAREWRATYPELEANQTVMLKNARANLDNTFIMTLETYVELVDRYKLFATPGDVGIGNAFVFRAGSTVEITLPNHPEDSINGKYFVRPEGTIDIGPLTNFPVAGKTSSQLREELKQSLAQWYRSYPDKDGLPEVNVNLPIFDQGLSADRTPWGEVDVFSLGGGGAGSGALSSTGGLRLRGNDTIMSVMSRIYSGSIDWHEIAIYRKIRTDRVDPDGRAIEYYLIVLVDLEKIVFEDPNLNMDIRDGDLIVMHVEKNPLIVEILETANVISGAWGSFSGVEAVLEDIFKRNF